MVFALFSLLSWLPTSLEQLEVQISEVGSHLQVCQSLFLRQGQSSLVRRS